MYGRIAKLRTRPGRRDAAVPILVRGIRAMPGCLAYVVAKDAADPDILWITEAWQDKASHEEALTLPAVAAAIAEVEPLVMGFETTIPVEPVGAVDLRQNMATAPPPE